MTGCEHAGCTAAATGRCHQCGRAICPGHHFSGRSETMTSAFCTECAQAEAARRTQVDAERRASLAKITAIATALVAAGYEPTHSFVWTYQTRSRWWAIGNLGRYTITRPVRIGWPVGDYPWEGRVTQQPGTTASEVFLSPTFVDSEGLLAPLNAVRTPAQDNRLLTGPMCADILATMELISATAHATPLDEFYDE